MAKIVNLKSENVKRIEAVEINPDGSLIVIGGNNAQGKSSLLDSIFYAFGGGRVIPEKVVRDGEESGLVSVELDSGLKVTRKITSAGKMSLKVQDKEGAAYKSPQAILDKMCGYIGFDPLKFTTLSDKEQAETLRDLLGIDFTDLDKKRGELYSERTHVNRELKSLSTQFDAVEYYEGLPDEEVSLAELVAKLEEQSEQRRRAGELENKITLLKANESNLNRRINELDDELSSLRCEAENVQDEYLDLESVLKSMDLPRDSEVNELQEQINTVEEANRKVRSNQRKSELNSSMDAAHNKSINLTEMIEDLDLEKKQILENADFPIDGLSFDDDGVIYNDIPLYLASAAEKLQVSVSIGIAMNPELKVILIRDGSLLDDDSMKLIAEMAEKNDMQIWIERVGHGEECSVIIEAGRVK